MTLEKDVANAADRVLVDGDTIRLVNNAFVYCFKGARLSTTKGSDLEHNYYIGQVSTNMRVLNGKDKDFFLTLIKLMKLQLKSLLHHANIFLLTVKI